MTDELASARNAVFQKLGRNIALFQQLERGLKDFFSVRVVEGSTADELTKCPETRRSEVATKSLGQVVKHIFEDLSKDDSEELRKPAESSATWMRASFRMENQETLEQTQESLKKLIGERNRLTHHLLEDFDLRNAEGIARLDALLDPQAERIREELLNLQDLLKHLAIGRRAMADLIGSDDFLESLA